jgi:ubiquinone/menaquinone biosynthesis C-methylase UbiE
MFDMERPSVDYNKLAPTYHSRYDGPSKLEGIAEALRGFNARTVLEVGCGTGRFIESLRTAGSFVYGVDSSTGMLSQAAGRLGSAGLAAAKANQLPFVPDAFDLICCVNAIHHFDDPRTFILDAVRLLKPGGAIAIIGMDPRTIRRRYYYEYFEGALDIDMCRYPSFGQLIDWVAEAQLNQVEFKIVEQSVTRFQGRAIFDDPFLQKRSNSLLAILTDDVYAKGLRRIEAAAERGAEFYSELPFGMVKGYRSPSASAKETA